MTIPSSKTHTMSFPVISNPYLDYVERAINACSCIPTPMAQKATAMIHSTFGAMQLFAGVYLMWNSSLGITKTQGHRMAQSVSETLHSSIDKMRLYTRIRLMQNDSVKTAKEQEDQIAHLQEQRAKETEEQENYNNYKSMLSSGSGHFMDGLENTVRGSIGWALGKYGLNAMQHFPGRLKLIPGALGGLTLLAVNLYFPSSPFGQINRSWRS